jgi:anti-sigma factor RsiW
MNCSEELLEGYLDEELDAARRADVEQHLAGCPACSETYARLRRQKDAIKGAAPYHEAPPGLRESIRGGLRRDAGIGRLRVQEFPSPVRQTPWRWLAIAASLLLALSVAWNLAQLGSRGHQELADALVAGHIRSLIGEHLMDVASTDQHTVKPWFTGKLDFAPDVRDFAAQGFPLVGGRVDYLAGRRVAALIYHRRQHVINLFIWPDGSSSAGKTPISRNGYNLLSWSRGSMTYWAVSDVSAGELEAFRALFQ